MFHMTSQDREQFVVDLPIDIKNALAQRAQDTNTPMTEIARRAIAEHLGMDYAGFVRASGRRPKLDIPVSERNTLKLGADRAANKAFMAGDIETGTLIARARVDLDYDTLRMLKDAADGVVHPAEAAE